MNGKAEDGQWWPPMIWIGGVQGAGKSTIATRLAHGRDLPLHRIDAWTYDHQARLPDAPSLATELAQGSAVAADAFEQTSRLRLELVLADVRARDLGQVPAVVEGPQLLPDAAGEQPSGWSVWLLTGASRNRRVRRQRAAAAGSADHAALLDALVARDELLAKRLRAGLDAHRMPSVEVPLNPDWDAIAAAVAAALDPALRGATTLPAGQPLRKQRRYENRVAARQGRLWAAAEQLDHVPPYPFACECGRRCCTATWIGTPADYDAATGLVTSPEHPTR